MGNVIIFLNFVITVLCFSLKINLKMCYEKGLLWGYSIFSTFSLHIKHCYWDGEGKDNAEGHVDPNALPIVTEIKKSNQIPRYVNSLICIL